jgi:cytochrome c oxidase assembly factor CtaG
MVLALTWWCHRATGLWSWHWRPYPGVWIVCIGLLVAHFTALQRGARRGEQRASTRQNLCYVAGVVLLWVTSDWPIGTIGAGYLISVHMLCFSAVVFAAVPLMMIGTPRWRFRQVLHRYHLEGASRTLARPVVAAVVYNVAFVAINTPPVVDRLRVGAAGGFALDMTWIVVGLVLWNPVCSPDPDLRISSPLVQMAYLFMATSFLTMITAGFITFSREPLYRTYELAPRISQLTALQDQQVSGVAMTLGAAPIVWGVMAYLFFTASDDELSRPRATTRPIEMEQL